MRAQQTLLSRYNQGAAPGRLEWIGVRPERKTPMLELAQVQAIAELGLEGDRRTAASPGSGRQVTLISVDQIRAIASNLGVSAIDPLLLRRNLVIAKINPYLLRHQRFSIGEAVFEGTASCQPCRRMEQALGVGGFSAMFGQGGICAKILVSGRIAVGDQIALITDS